MINNVISNVDFVKILHFCKKNNILYQFVDDKGNFLERCPSISDLVDDLGTILIYVIERDLEYFQYGNWVITWKNKKKSMTSGNEAESLEVIFSLDRVFIMNDSDSNRIKTLEEMLNVAIENEEFEQASKLKEKIDELLKNENDE